MGNLDLHLIKGRPAVHRDDDLVILITNPCTFDKTVFSILLQPQSKKKSEIIKILIFCFVTSLYILFFHQCVTQTGRMNIRHSSVGCT
jgi:hypothetical protein